MQNAYRFVLLLFAVVMWCTSSPAAMADDEPSHADGDEHAHVEGEGHEAGDDNHGHADSEHPHAEEDGHGHDNEDGHDHADGEHGHDEAGHGHHGEGDHHDDHHHHAGPASNHPLSIDPDLAIATLVIFAVLLIVLHKFAWGPILQGLALRETGIADDIAAAGSRRKEAEKMLEEYQSQLERAGAEVRAMLDGAKKEAEAMKQSILEEASKTAAAEKEQATSEIIAAKDAAIAEIGSESINIAFRVASGALRREVKPEDHQEVIANAGL